jgi:hypothetical protein
LPPEKGPPVPIGQAGWSPEPEYNNNKNNTTKKRDMKKKHEKEMGIEEQKKVETDKGE